MATVAVGAMNLLRQHVGETVEIRDGKLRTIRRNGKVHADVELADTTKLKWLTSLNKALSAEYVVVFADGRELRFEAQIENYLELLRTLEQ